MNHVSDVSDSISVNPGNHQEEEESKNRMILEREELMVSSSGELPMVRNAYFLKPLLLNPTQNQPLPKPPSLFLSPNPKTVNELKRMFVFKGGKVSQSIWKKWVDKLRPTHQEIWKKVGIFDAIRASTIVIKPDDELIIQFAHHWCLETNSFIFRWGECSITLEDVMILGGFSVIGDCVSSDSQCSRFDEILGKLVDSCGVIRSGCKSGQLSHSGWMSYFKEQGGELEHVGFLVQWMSRYVFCTDSYDVDAPVFALAIRLADGVKIALAPAVLASIYRDLGLMKRKIVAFDSGKGYGGSNLVVCSPIQLVQVWVWERFSGLSLIPKCLVHGEPRLSRWHGVDIPGNRNLRLGMKFTADDFLWRPYCICLENWEFPKFYSEKGVWLLVDSEFDEELLSYVRCLMPCELVGLDSVELYLPHRVGKQFGMSQDIPGLISSFYGNVELASSSYRITLDRFEVYLPPRMLMGSVTVRYFDWWRPILHIRDGALMASQRETRWLRRRVSKKKNVSSLRRSPLCSYRASNKTIDVDSSGSDEEKSMGKSSPLKNLESQIPLSMANDVVSLQVMNPSIRSENTRTVEYVATPVDGGNGCRHSDGSRSQTDSLVAVSKAGNVNEPVQFPYTENDHRDVLVGAELKQANNSFEDVNMKCDVEQVAELSESLCRKNKGKGTEILHCSAPCNHPMGTDFVGSSWQTPLRNSPPPEELPSDNVVNAVDEVHAVSLLNSLTPRVPEVNMVCNVPHENEQGKAAETAVQEKAAIHEPTIVSDDEDIHGYAAFELLVQEIENRINELERVVSPMIKAAKFI